MDSTTPGSDPAPHRQRTPTGGASCCAAPGSESPVAVTSPTWDGPSRGPPPGHCAWWRATGRSRPPRPPPPPVVDCGARSDDVHPHCGRSIQYIDNHGCIPFGMPRSTGRAGILATHRVDPGSTGTHRRPAHRTSLPARSCHVVLVMHRGGRGRAWPRATLPADQRQPAGSSVARRCGDAGLV